jgi:hypothetical protein
MVSNDSWTHALSVALPETVSLKDNETKSEDLFIRATM